MTSTNHSTATPPVVTAPPAARIAPPVAPGITKPGDWCGTPVPGVTPSPSPQPYTQFRGHLYSARTDAMTAVDVLKMDLTMPVRPETPAAAAMRAARDADSKLELALGNSAPIGASNAASLARKELAAGMEILKTASFSNDNIARDYFSSAVNWMNIADSYVTFKYATGGEPNQ